MQQGDHRLTRLEEWQEAGAASSTPLRASSSSASSRKSSGGDALAALQAQVQAQQQRLQGQMEALAAGVQKSIPGQARTCSWCLLPELLPAFAPTVCPHPLLPAA